jgi:hypothetical protein
LIQGNEISNPPALTPPKRNSKIKFEKLTLGPSAILGTRFSAALGADGFNVVGGGIVVVVGVGNGTKFPICFIMAQSTGKLKERKIIS